MDFVDFIEYVKSEFPYVDNGQIEKFRAMDGLYRDWNVKINVISRKDIDGLYEHHVLHSLGIASYMQRNGGSVCDERELGEGLSFLDLGTGGGFPGIPLAVLMPKAHFLLCDSIGKKLRVASAVASALGLQNVEVVNMRAESLDVKVDHVVSRAVTSLDAFYPWVKGKFSRSILYLKGGDVNDEITTMMTRYRMRKGSVHCWKLDNWLQEDYFAEKFVIEIEKD